MPRIIPETPVKLIGEIERKEGKATYDALQDCLRSIFNRSNRFDLSLLQTKQGYSRAVMSLYLVWTGIFFFGQEQGHEFWPHVFQGLGHQHDPNLSWRCGLLFLLSLKENDLEIFPSVKEGHVYLTRILLHGIIPERHIERFVREFVLDAVSQPKGLYESAQTLIDRWNNREFNVPKPIKRFLQYGAPTNADVVERFLEMARRWEEDDQESWWQWGLPKYMVEAFRKCVNATRTRVIREVGRSSPGERPYLIFDYTRENQPVVVVPPQKLEKEGALEITCRDLKNEENVIVETESLGSAFRWKDNSIYSEIMHVPTRPSKDWQVKIANSIHRVAYSFPEGDSGRKAPIYLFNSNSGKALVFRSDKRIPRGIILVFPKLAELEMTGGSLLSEPIDLHGKWQEWHYTFCVLEEDGFFQYSGPDCSLVNNIQEKLSFRAFGEESDEPFLKSQYEAPHWLKCDDQRPIIFNPEGLHIFLTEQAYRIWRRGVGRLLRLDSPNKKRQSTPFRLSDAKETENGRVLAIPGIDNIEPGVYEISLRGAIGVEAISLPFLYLPLLSAKRTLSGETMPIARDFLLEFSEPIALLPLANTEITPASVVHKVTVTLKEDRADAYCALRAFHESVRPITLLLERSDIRWVRHSETGVLDWPYWRSRPEVIPIQRLDEIRDSRALVEVTSNYPESAWKPFLTPKEKLRTILEGRIPGSAKRNILMSYEASRLKRRYRTIWVINLRQFSDQLKDVRHFQEADISVDFGHESGNVTLFTLLRYPEYRGFTVQPLGVDQKSEKIRVGWEEHPNEPRNNRILRIHPVEKADHQDLNSIPIPDGHRPPVTVSIEPVQEAKPWVAQMDIVQGRFYVSRDTQETGAPKVRWMRVPPAWYDWMEWSDLSPNQYPEYLSYIENASVNVDLQFMPWTYFLHNFYCCKTKESAQELRRLLGEKLINKALPHTKGSSWEVKKDSKTCLTLHIEASSVNCSDTGLRCFEDCSPDQWCCLPTEGEIKLVMRQAHRYLGEPGTVWALQKATGDEKPLMSSEWGGNLEIDIWLDDAIGDGKKGILQARLPLDTVWDNPAYFPILNMIKQRDSIFIMENEDDEGFGTVLSELRSNKESQEQAINLVDRWDAWSKSSDVNPLLRRMIRGRLENSKVTVISGASAFLLRLRANGHDSSISKGGFLNASTIKTMEALLVESKDFAKSYLPKAFLRDLIISELLISWYWNKSFCSKTR
ncbi:MAG: hypothetical protein JRJ31_17445 [Deltaproteobacteria bacterium]|nr:hypothetical protein [Deltaproteobacteria bacterium]